MIVSLVDEAMVRGARQARVCETLGLDRRTVQRWKSGPAEDQRRGPRRSPGNKLSASERSAVLKVVNQPEHRDLPPSQIVPRLADILGNPSPATLAIKVNPDGSVAMTVVLQPSDNETFTEVAIQFAQNIEYNPAQKNGQPVAGWTQQVFSCCQRR